METGYLIKLLKDELLEKNVIREEIAQKIDVTVSYLNRMLRGTKMSTELFEQIMDASEVTLHDLANRFAGTAVQQEKLPARIAAIEQKLAELPLRMDNFEGRLAEIESKI